MSSKMFRPSQSMVSRTVGDEVILVPIRGDAADLDCIYTLNETAAVVWRLVAEGYTPAAAAERIAGDYRVTEAEAVGDVNACLQELLSIGALVEGAGDDQ